jgi:hypothetical protein
MINTLLFATVVLIWGSARFEGYQWTAAALVGVLLTLVGNVFVLMQPRPVAKSRKNIAKIGLNENYNQGIADRASEKL